MVRTVPDLLANTWWTGYGDPRVVRRWVNTDGIFGRYGVSATRGTSIFLILSTTSMTASTIQTIESDITTPSKMFMIIAFLIVCVGVIVLQNLGHLGLLTTVATEEAVFSATYFGTDDIKPIFVLDNVSNVQIVTVALNITVPYTDEISIDFADGSFDRSTKKLTLNGESIQLVVMSATDLNTWLGEVTAWIV